MAIPWFVLGLAVARRLRPGPAARAVAIALGPFSAFGDAAFAYLRFWRPGTDVARLLEMAPAPTVHAAFVVALVLGAVGLRALRSEDARAPA